MLSGLLWQVFVFPVSRYMFQTLLLPWSTCYPSFHLYRRKFSHLCPAKVLCIKLNTDARWIGQDLKIFSPHTVGALGGLETPICCNLIFMSFKHEMKILLDYFLPFLPLMILYFWCWCYHLLTTSGWNKHFVYLILFSFPSKVLAAKETAVKSSPARDRPYWTAWQKDVSTTSSTCFARSKPCPEWIMKASPRTPQWPAVLGHCWTLAFASGRGQHKL